MKNIKTIKIVTNLPEGYESEDQVLYIKVSEGSSLSFYCSGDSELINAPSQSSPFETSLSQLLFYYDNKVFYRYRNEIVNITDLTITQEYLNSLISNPTAEELADLIGERLGIFSTWKVI